MKASLIRYIRHSRFVDGFIHLLYPSSCLICQEELTRHEQDLCSICTDRLHYTYFETFTDPTPLDQLFWGRVQLEFSYSLLYYEKHNSSKLLLAALKYANRPDVGQRLGTLIANRMKATGHLHQVDCLIPVPLHPRKEFLRGYNQSAMLAEGISRATSLPVKDLVKRTEHSGSQTTLGRFRRWDNVQGRFAVHPDLAKFRHVVLVDDVITTGSTLEAIIHLIRQEVPDIRISVISLALAK